MSDDWREDVLRTLPYLRGQRFVRKAYTAYRPDWDHDHCAVCSTKLAELEGVDVVHEGYAITDEYRKGADYEWVCPECFESSKDTMNWVDVTRP